MASLPKRKLAIVLVVAWVTADFLVWRGPKKPQKARFSLHRGGVGVFVKF
jgi:hypothetical protein